MLVRDVVKELTDGPVQRRMLELGRQVCERPEDEGALGEEQVRDVEVVGDADDLAAIEEDVDVESPRGEAPCLGRPRGRVRPSAVSTACTRSSSACGGSVVSTATTQLRYQVVSSRVRPGSLSQGSAS